MSFVVDLDGLDAAVGSLEQLEATITRRLGELDDALASLHSTWSGQTAAAQQETHARWVSSAQEMHRALGELRAAARHAHTGYAAAASANLRTWASTR